MTNSILFVVILSVAVTLIGKDSRSFAAEPGSAGGTLGKKSKSISGGGNSASPARKSKPLKKKSSGRTRSGYVMTGTWHVKQKCNTGRFEIMLYLKQTSATTFGGSTKGLTTGASSQISDGRISGKQVSLRRSTPDRWIGRLSASGRTMTGSTKGPFWSCTYTATKR